MKTIVKAIFALLLALPLGAQSPIAAGRVGYGGSGLLLLVGERTGLLYDGLQALLRDDELSDMGLAFDNVLSESRYYAPLAEGLGLSPGSTWALVDAGGHCLLQGSVLPTAGELRKALEKAGMKSPTRVLRDFLRERPDHLEARAHLLSRIRATAESRTRQALQLNAESLADMTRRPDQDAEGWLRMFSQILGNIDTDQFQGRELDAEQDIRIWGPYAQELQALFATGEWRLVGLHAAAEQIPVEACSPLMVGLYGRHISAMEDLLVERPGSMELWNTYVWTKAVAKRGSVKELVDRVTPTPGTAPFWPHEGLLALLISEEREAGDWASIADRLWGAWPKLRASARFYASLGDFSSIVPDARAKGFFEHLTRVYYLPLLEALIKLDRVGDAETIVLDMAKLQPFGDYRSRAADLARTAGRADLHERWMALRTTQGAPVADTEDLDFVLDGFLAMTPSAFVLLTDPDPYQTGQINTMFGQGRLFEWRLFGTGIDDEQSALMKRREGWPATGMHWALIGPGRKILAHGSELPGEEQIYQALRQANVPPAAEALRSFLAKNPDHLMGRLELLTELKRLAEYKTMEKLRTEGIPGRLSQEDDHAIWGEYASLYRRVLPQLLDDGNLGEENYPYESDYFAYSPVMESVARSLLHRVEAALARRPMDNFLWSTWLSLSGYGEHRNISDLVKSLQPSPLDDPLDLPPRALRGRLMFQLRSGAKWQTIVDILEWRWEARKNDASSLSPRLWYMDAINLLEAYLRLDKESDANALLMHWDQSPGWKQILEEAIEVATKCEKADLAQRWERMK